MADINIGPAGPEGEPAGGLIYTEGFLKAYRRALLGFWADEGLLTAGELERCLQILADWEDGKEKGVYVDKAL